MTERDIMMIVDADSAEQTDFSDPYWVGVDSLALESCYNKGFLQWVNGKLTITALGRRSFGALQNERHYQS